MLKGEVTSFKPFIKSALLKVVLILQYITLLSLCRVFEGFKGLKYFQSTEIYYFKNYLSIPKINFKFQRIPGYYDRHSFINMSHYKQKGENFCLIRFIPSYESTSTHKMSIIVSWYVLELYFPFGLTFTSQHPGEKYGLHGVSQILELSV